MGLISTIIIGFVVGLLARALKPGKDALGWIGTILVGIVGALLGGYMGRVLGIYSPDQPAGFVASIIGAIIILAIIQAFSKRQIPH